MAEVGMDSTGALAHENTAVIYWVILAGIRLPAHTEIHDPDEACFPDKVLEYFRRQKYAAFIGKRLTHFYNIIFCEADHVVVLKKPLVHFPGDKGNFDWIVMGEFFRVQKLEKLLTE